MSRTPREIREALEDVRESDVPSSKNVQIVEEELRKIWKKIQGSPNSYIMTELEFAIFNRYRNREEYKNALAQRAVERHWGSRRS
jgi:glutamine synthetase